MGVTGISLRGKEGAMPTSEPDSYIDLQPTESDFHVPDEAERLTRPIKQKTLREIRRIASKLDTNPETTQYLLIIDVSDNLRDYLLNNRIGGGVRLTVDDHNILLRIMPSLQFECVVCDFTCFFGEAMARAGLHRDSDSWVPTGSAQRNGFHCGKQPDFSVVPFPYSPTVVPRWLSFVVEVGMSQSHRALQRDAEWWVRNSNNNTRLVLLFKVHKKPFCVDVELWSAPGGTRPGLPISQSATPGLNHPKLFNPCTEIKIMQALRVTEGEVTLVKGPGLDIILDYELLMREDRPTGQADILITQRMLQIICEAVQYGSG